MGRNEAQTRFELIDPGLIDQRDWSRTDIHIEETAAPVDIVYGKGRRRPKGRTDYVLRRPLEPNSEPIPLAIIEAKHEGLPPEHGLQQGRNYRVGQLHHVPFVFSTNGHLFVEYSELDGLVSEAKPLAEFPTPDELLQRYAQHRKLSMEGKALQLFTTGYAQGRGYLRYYQDASIRAACEEILTAQKANRPPRALLSLATGSGKTRIAAALLRRLFDAGFMGKALFLCDRTELRDNGLNDFQAAFGTDAAEVDTRHPQKNARVLIATYQTLDNDIKGEDSTFFLRHYPPGFFDVIVIDECHRSAWGEWHVILEQNREAIQIGLTATPRQIRFPEVPDEQTRAGIEEDRRRLADNYRYFGDPVYEYPYLQGVADGYLAPVEIETYDLFHDGHHDPERVRGVYRRDLAGKQLTNARTGRAASPNDVAERTDGSGLEAKLILPDRVATMCAHLFERLLATGEDDPLQKTIVFCASDHHADLVANEMNNLYTHWCRQSGQKRVQTYAFKCMASSNGQSLIPDFRGRQRSHLIATTKELLTTGVNVPCVRNIVFFRYIQSPILFLQMIGRGTRIDEATSKLMFRILDYTGATTLFGADLTTKPSGPGGNPPPPPPPTTPPPRVKVKGVQIDIQDSGRFHVMGQDGRLTRVTPQQYQQRLVEELTAAVPTLAAFRDRWLDPAQRGELMEQLAGRGLLPGQLREAAKMDEYDLFDVLAALAYGIQPRKRSERAGQFDDSGHDWLIHLPQPTAKVIRAIVRQFEKAGTDGLEATELWHTPEIEELHGLEALKQGGNPADLMRKTKEALFVA